jgi:flagellum-specific ATP synthase
LKQEMHNPMLEQSLAQLRSLEVIARTGTIRRVMPTWLEADGPNVPVGTVCEIGVAGNDNGLRSFAEVIRVDANSISLLPYFEVSRIEVGAQVRAVTGAAEVPVGRAFLGRAIDALGQPIDGGERILPEAWQPLHQAAPLPLSRETPNEILETGIRAIDGLLTLGVGQRVGVFAASGVGKTSLLSQLIRQVETDVCIICLVGERGREVEAIWEKDLTNEARTRATLIAATSDQAAALRVRAVMQALALARYWRDLGLRVLFVLDSITRFAMALRERGLAAGEPPTVRAYTPSVFSIIPQVVEQCGALKNGGSISAVMTVLSENDDVEDPLSELMKSLLDGHFVLSRALAERRHFPAVDPLRSVSRNSSSLLPADQRAVVDRAHALIARYEGSRALIESGLYVAGSNAEIDEAIATQPAIDSFLRQGLDEKLGIDSTLEQLGNALKVNHVAA